MMANGITTRNYVKYWACSRSNCVENHQTTPTRRFQCNKPKSKGNCASDVDDSKYRLPAIFAPGVELYSVKSSELVSLSVWAELV